MLSFSAAFVGCPTNGCRPVSPASAQGAGSDRSVPIRLSRLSLSLNFYPSPGGSYHFTLSTTHQMSTPLICPEPCQSERTNRRRTNGQNMSTARGTQRTRMHDRRERAAQRPMFYLFRETFRWDPFHGSSKRIHRRGIKLEY